MSPLKPGFTIRVFDRNWGRVHLLKGVKISPRNWDGRDVGGPDIAEVRLDGTLEALNQAPNWLGYRVAIMSPDKQYIWWGDIEGVTISDKGTVSGCTLEGVANRIKVLYTVFDAGGGVSAGETDWAEDSESIALYGRREKRHSAGKPMRAAQAERMRNTLLKDVSRPIPVLDSLGAGTETFGTLHLEGFWRRLGRVYYTNNEGLTEYVDGSLAYPLGMGITSSNIAAVNLDGKYHFHQIFARLKGFAIPGLQFRVSGMAQAGNNGAFTVENGDAKDEKVLTASNIKFDPADDIEESPYAYQLVDFDVDDVIQISGAAQALNNGSHLIKTPSSTHIEISPSWSNAIVTEAPGASVTIRRGNQVTVKETTTNERTGANATITAYGQMIAQSFQTGTAAPWDAATVEVHIRKEGAPTDDVAVRLYTNSAGSPGTWVATATIANADIPGDDMGVWVSAAFDINYTLNPATTYWLVLVRADPNDAFNYYQVWMDEAAGYASGALKLHDGSAFQTPAEAKSLCFRVLGAVDTSDQLKAICESMGVFSGVFATLSGVKTHQYRDGKQTAAEEAAALMDTGDGSNQRIVATVGPQRNVTIRPIPDKSTAKYLWMGETKLATLQRTRVTLGLLPVAQWCELDNQKLLQGPMAKVSPFFVGYAGYDVDGGWRLNPARQPDPWSIGEVQNG